MQAKQPYIILGLSVLVFTSLISCIHYDNSNVIQGNRQYSTIDRTLSSYTAIEINGNFKVELNPAYDCKVTIDADSNLHNYIYTEVNNGKLVISTPDNCSLKSIRDVRLLIGVKGLKSLRIFGASQVNTSSALVFDTLHFEVAGASSSSLSLKGNYFKADFPGAVMLDFEGSVNRFDVSVAGTGQIDALDLKSSSCSVNLAGAAKADVFATDTLEVNIAGIGQVNYKGKPLVVHSNIGGIGKLNALDN